MVKRAAAIGVAGAVIGVAMAAVASFLYLKYSDTLTMVLLALGAQGRAGQATCPRPALPDPATNHGAAPCS